MSWQVGIIIAVTGFSIGWLWQGSRLDARIATIQQAQATAELGTITQTLNQERADQARKQAAANQYQQDNQHGQAQLQAAVTRLDTRLERLRQPGSPPRTQPPAPATTGRAGTAPASNLSGTDGEHPESPLTHSDWLAQHGARLYQLGAEADQVTHQLTAVQHACQPAANVDAANSADAASQP